MKVVLVDNGSLEPAAHQGLRDAASAIGERAGISVEAVSWKHSGRIPGGALGSGRAWTLAPWVRAQAAAGEREFLVVPFFISPQGAIGSLLRSDLERLREETGGFDYAFTEGLDVGNFLPAIVAGRVREAAAAGRLRSPAVVVVDHGGPSRESADVRDRTAEAARLELGAEISALAAASMESPRGPGYEFNRPLLRDVLSGPGFNTGDVLIAPLFLSAGRHAGPAGDLEGIARAAEARSPALRCIFTGLVGSHPIAVGALADAVARTLGVGLRP